MGGILWMQGTPAADACVGRRGQARWASVSTLGAEFGRVGSQIRGGLNAKTLARPTAADGRR